MNEGGIPSGPQISASILDFEFLDDMILSKSISGLSFIDDSCEKILNRESSQSIHCQGNNEPSLSRDNSDGFKLFLSKEDASEGFAFLSRENSCSDKFFSQDAAPRAQDPADNLPLPQTCSSAQEGGDKIPCCPEIYTEPSPQVRMENTAIEILGILGAAELAAQSQILQRAAQSRQAISQDNLIRLDPSSLSPIVTIALGSYARPRGEPRDTRRGAHVRERPEMQRTARDGAVHWATQLRVVRAAWAARAFWSPQFRARFGAQAESAQGRIKSKQECLLRFLQMAAADGVIAVGPFSPAGGFFGWTRFAVVGERAAEFRAGLAALYPAGFKEDTLKETFRRAGLVPERFQWELGWRGAVAFEYRPKRARF